jgi:hypothetical protein
MSDRAISAVIPAKAGTQTGHFRKCKPRYEIKRFGGWVPAFAGMTNREIPLRNKKQNKENKK